jgi:lipoprotein-releasing system permease protein
MLGMMRDVEYYLAQGVSAESALAKPRRAGNMPGIILGRDILSQLNVHPDFLDVIEVIAPLADVGPTGELEPRLKRFVLVGSFTSNIYEFDTLYALVNIEEAESLLGLQASRGWQVRLKDPRGVPAIVSDLRETLGDNAKVEGWHERNRKLFAALKLERVAMGGVMTLVILIASFSVIGVVMMVVSSKRKDIALLQSMGMRKGLLRTVFLKQGTWIGIVGSLIGCALGILICFALMRWPVQLPQSYYVEVLQVSIKPLWVASVAVLGVALAMTSSLYPVYTAMRDDPAVVLRYE